MSDFLVSPFAAPRILLMTLDPVRFAHFLSLVPDTSRVALLDQLAADVRKVAADVARAWTEPPDWDGLRCPCQALIGLASTIGAEAAHAAATALDEAARACDVAAATVAHDHLIRVEAALLAEIGAAYHRAKVCA